ncbi:hypothetical protein M2130_002139, partial [Polynucleobacter sphagniphilus]|nr:hypothetical protein [Polynucleobacter sphagniphilus]
MSPSSRYFGLSLMKIEANPALNRYQYLRHFPTSLGTALQILPEKVHCCNYGV